MEINIDIVGTQTVEDGIYSFVDTSKIRIVETSKMCFSVLLHFHPTTTKLLMEGNRVDLIKKMLLMLRQSQLPLLRLNFPPGFV